MTHAFFSLTEPFARLRARHVAPTDKRSRSRLMRARLVRSNNLVRANPELRDFNGAEDLVDRLLIAWHNYRVRKRWQRELRALDDRLLRDAGISRLEAERAAGRPGVWI